VPRKNQTYTFAAHRIGLILDILPSAPKMPRTTPMIWAVTEIETVSQSPDRMKLSGRRIESKKKFQRYW
jgi:hypothetical protein